MSRQGKQSRLDVRFPFRTTVSYRVLGEDFRPPWDFKEEGEMIDLSNHGARIFFRRMKVKVGFMLILRIPVLEISATVPTLAQVKWVKENVPGVWHAGLSFML